MPPAPWTLDSIPGTLPATDMRVFDWLLSYQSRFYTAGDLLELGAHLGRSAVLMARHLREEERFTVCDLFPAEPGAQPVRGLFETNYLAFHEALPVIVEGPSSAIRDHVKPASCRFVHIDASKRYEDVTEDLTSARDLIVPDGIVAVDGYRDEDAPGVAAAVWEACSARGLRPICLTPQKFYGTWGDPGPVQEQLAAWLAERADEWATSEERVCGHRVLRVAPRADAGEEERRDTKPLPEIVPGAPAWTSKRTGRKGRRVRRMLKLLFPSRMRKLR
ncbi:class I SAM-dependent methyltransferase [Thermocatellispora tengchongensis]|uniref:class I SAM-dependent methyltransferase n=1 Tax=Thermocatellispora tengchongensis TaxID=1073253 RepID=UPI0028AD45F4|nr:class I SAM-dependent methyltransferase [Thermocatellispora tengchongensis]